MLRLYYNIFLESYRIERLIASGYGVMNIKAPVSETFAIAECRADYSLIRVEAAYKGCAVFQLFPFEPHVRNR